VDIWYSTGSENGGMIEITELLGLLEIMRNKKNEITYGEIFK
jgi:hypothetical protein